MYTKVKINSRKQSIHDLKIKVNTIAELTSMMPRL